MKKLVKECCRRPAVLVLLAVELLILLSSLAAALRPVVQYAYTPDQWEVIAQQSTVTYDEEGRRGVTQMSEGEPILQTPAMSLPAGHYRVQLEYRYRPGMDADGVEHHASVYFTAGEEMAVSGEHGWVDGNAQQDTVVLNVDYASDTVRLVANNDGGIFTIGDVTIREDKTFAWACVLGWLTLFLLADLALLGFCREARRRCRTPACGAACGCWRA